MKISKEIQDKIIENVAKIQDLDKQIDQLREEQRNLILSSDLEHLRIGTVIELQGQAFRASAGYLDPVQLVHVEAE